MLSRERLIFDFSLKFPYDFNSFLATAAQQPLRPPRWHKGKKRTNLYQGPQEEDPLGTAVSFRDNTIWPHLVGDDPNVMTDDGNFPDLQRDCDFLEDNAKDTPILPKVLLTFPDGVDPDFDVAFDEAKHGAYLGEHLKTSHPSPATATRLVKVLKRHWRVFNPDRVQHNIIGYE